MIKAIGVCLAGLFLSIACCLDAYADMGPKPTIFIELPPLYLGKVDNGVLLLCKRSDCSDGRPLEMLGPQAFGCGSDSCDGLAYGFSPYLQLVLTLTDGQEVKSNVFTKNAFDARYGSSLTDHRFIVQEK